MMLNMRNRVMNQLGLRQRWHENEQKTPKILGNEAKMIAIMFKVKCEK